MVEKDRRVGGQMNRETERQNAVFATKVVVGLAWQKKHKLVNKF
jgi:hypothetical protein